MRRLRLQCYKVFKYPSITANIQRSAAAGTRAAALSLERSWKDGLSRDVLECGPSGVRGVTSVPLFLHPFHHVPRLP